MRKFFGLLFILCLSLFSCKTDYKETVEITLDTNWEFKSTEDSVWDNAVVPGNVFSDLKRLNKIPDPLVGQNELDVQWVSEKEWVYKTSFIMPDSILNKEHVILNFNGIDTYANVYLNDSLILVSNNAFRSWSVPVKRIIKRENELRVNIEPTLKYEDDFKKQSEYELPEGARVYTRKPQFQYGWDWGPKLNLSGIHEDITIKAWDKVKLNDVYVKVDSLSTEKAFLEAQVAINVHDVEELDALLYINDKLITKNSVVINSKQESFIIPFTVNNPKLWWTHNLGDPYRYKISVKLQENKTVYAQHELMYGIRTVKLVTNKDDVGEKFYFELNGEPIYMKGANYIPQHSLNENTKIQTEQLIKDTKKANMNMLRVWGGGVYESDGFYELCDQNGILVWQDFMFACAMYPGDKSFLNNVKEEAVYQVKRLRNHASIALWCGNNESSEGWKRWGWQQGRNEQEIQSIWSNYKKLFNDLLPSVVNEYSTTSYWESSPKFGRGNPSYQFEGDAHDWWVWHDGKPFEHFQQVIPRFMSEFGFQSYPSYQSIKHLTQLDSISLSDKAFKTHQKHARGNQLIATYMDRDFIVPDNDLDYVYTSQLVQARGITMGIEAQRSAKPYCMGSLFWQLNDCWPVVSWSSIDGLGEWKALHYKVKRSFDNVLLSMGYANDKVVVTLVNDNLEPVSDTLDIQLRDFYGNVLWEKEKYISVRSNVSETIYEHELKKSDIKLDEVYMHASFGDGEQTLLFVSPKLLRLPEAKLSIKTKKVSDGYELTLSSNVFIKDLFLSTHVKGFFEENFIDIHPNKDKVIVFKTKSLETPEFLIQSLNKIYQDSLLK